MTTGGAAQQVHADEVGDVPRSRPRRHLGERPVLGDPAVLEHDDAVGERDGVDGSWVTRTRAPAKVARCVRRSRRTSVRVPTSSAASGSSSSSEPRLVASARASATRCACPPRARPGFAPAWSPRPTRSSHSAARRRASTARARGGCAGRRRRSRARSGGGTAGSPGTRRRRRGARGRRRCRRPGRRRTSSSMTMRPASIGGARRARAAWSSCPRRSARAPRRSPRRRRRGRRRGRASPTPDADGRVKTHGPLRTSGRAARRARRSTRRAARG